MAAIQNLTVQHYYKLDECERSKAPTKLDLKETSDLLYDFGIYATIPNFRSRSQLLQCRASVIKEKLNRDC